MLSKSGEFIVKISTIILSAALLMGTLWVLPVGNALAWKTDQSSSSYCSDANSAVIGWSFKNTEPNQPNLSMDVVVKDNQTGTTSDKVTVPAGQTATGNLDTGETTLGEGTLTYTLTWTDGRKGVDTRTSSYDASDCTPPVQPPEFTAHITCTVVEGEAIYKLVIDQTAGADAVYSPANGTVLKNGEEIAVTATYLDEDEQSQTISTKATASEDCTPPIEVCRDGAVISIHPDERLDSDTELPCPEIIPPAEVLPVTGIGGIIAGMLGLTGVGTGIGSWIKSRKALRSGMLS